jgi:hypothetical protein
MDQLIPMISQKVIESIKPTLKKMVDDSLLPELDASLLGCSGVVGLEFNLACFCTWSRDGHMLSGLNGSDLLLLLLGVCVRNLSNDSCLPPFAILNVAYNPLPGKCYNIDRKLLFPATKLCNLMLWNKV